VALPIITARTYLWRALTNFEPRSRVSLIGGPGRWWLSPLLRGPVSIAEGPARGLLLDARHLPLAHVQAFGLIRGLLELPVQEALRRMVRPGAVVYDVGANVGFFSLLAGRVAGPAGAVEAFEPSPDAALALRANVAINGMTQIRVHQTAVARSHGRAEFLLLPEPSQSHLKERSPHREASDTITVEVTSIDEAVGSLGLRPPDMIKIDTEGSEVDVLEGARRTLTKHRPVVICELHKTNLEILELLADLGYAVENLDGPEPVTTAGDVHILARFTRPTT